MITNLPTMYQDDNVKEWCADNIIEAILATLPGIETAYDLGCGSGVYVQAFSDAGIDIIGFDDNSEEIKQVPGCHDNIIWFDVGKTLILNPVDLIFSIEVAEHIDPSDLDTFIGNIVRFANKWIVFTGSNKAHSPGHVNPQSNEYWRERITEREKHKYRADLSQTIMESCKSIIGRPSCLRWFQENLQVFERIENDNKTRQE